MGYTKIDTTDNVAKKLWEETVYREVAKKNILTPFKGGMDAIINVNRRLAGERGDRIRFTLIPRLTSDGVTGEQTLLGREQSLANYTFDVNLEAYREAVRDSGAMSRQRSAFSISDESLAALKKWMTEKQEKLCFDALDAAILAGYSKVFYGGTATSTATLASTDVLTSSMLAKIAAFAYSGGGRAYQPVEKVAIPGIPGENYLLVVPPAVGYSLRTDQQWREAQYYSADRGPDNSLFSGFLGRMHGVVVMESEFVPQVTNYGSGANVAAARCVLLGKSALLWAEAAAPTFIEDTFDYEFQKAVAVQMIMGVQAPVWNSKTQGSIGVIVARDSSIG